MNGRVSLSGRGGMHGSSVQNAILMTSVAIISFGALASLCSPLQTKMAEVQSKQLHEKIGDCKQADRNCTFF